jgi:predicted flap endonuclease-1-like 5' DNA nuclease
MSGKTVAAAFTAVFFLPMVVTLLVPAFPPASYLLDFLRIPRQITTLFWGISEQGFIDGVTNGIFWLIIASILYGFISFASKSDPLLPMPEPTQLKVAPPEPMPFDNRPNKIRPLLALKRIGKRKNRTEYDIEMIEGIGPIRGTLLRNAGIKTVDDLLKISATKRGQQHLAKTAGVSEDLLLKWVSRGDLIQVRGVGTQYSGLLESAGVNSAADLSMRNPSFLHQTLKAVNKEKKLVKRIPPARTIRAWVNDAKTLSENRQIPTK